MPKVLNLIPAAPGSAGKRRQNHMTSSSESEDDVDVDVASPSSCSDYENITSPSSSTCSGPIYVRTPGFQHHAHHISRRPKTKKKRTILADVQPQQHKNHIIQHQHVIKDSSSYYQKKPVPHYGRDRTPVMRALKNPLPMRLRALPQSFWQQPNKPATLNSGPLFQPLPPLATKEEDIRPVSPTTSDSEPVTETTVTDRNGNVLRHKQLPQERKITVGNTDLLLKLFENVEKRGNEKTKSTTSSIQRTHNSIRRRPTKVVPISNASIASGEDPYMVSGLSEQLFPQLSLEHSQKLQNENTSLHLVTLNAGDRAVTLPALTVEQNYSQMLSELVMHI